MRSFSSAGSLLREGERDDVLRLNTRLPEDRSDALRDDLGLAGPGTRDDLERLVDTGDRLSLSLGVGGHLGEDRDVARGRPRTARRRPRSSPLGEDINSTSNTFMTSSP